MNKVLALVSCVLLGACGDSVYLREDAEARLLAGAEGIRQLMLAGDMAAVVDQIPDDLFPRGPAGKEAALTGMPEDTRDSTFALAVSMVFDLPKTIHRVG